ncbi:MAG: RlmE family RNA methyltransferase [Deltaproteobacteria bacterium]|nr:RlmE family RNA methyltransferase [Deltaproteobacteria bacterium]
MGGHRRKQDHFAKRARREKYPARSVYKLEEIDKRVGLLNPGMCVLDLGAAPGSWSLYVAGKVTPSGKVIAVDRAPMTIGLPAHVLAMTASALDVVPAKLLELIPKKGFDVVISDMAPRTSGHRFVDQSRSYQLFMRALTLGAELCAPGGRFVGKIFVGEDFENARQEVRRLFGKDKIIRPKSVRSESFETYVVGMARNDVAVTPSQPEHQ